MYGALFGTLPAQAVRIAVCNRSIDETIRQLRARLASDNADARIACDLVFLLHRAGLAAQAIELYENFNFGHLPSHTLLAAARAYRDLKQFQQAAALARLGMAGFPSEAIWPVQAALALADEGKPDEALAMLETSAARGTAEIQWLFAKAYAQHRGWQPFDALGNSCKALERVPENA